MERQQSRFYVGQKVRCITGFEKDHPARKTWPYNLIPYRDQILTVTQIVIAPDFDGSKDIGLRFKEITNTIGGDKEACFDHNDFVPVEELPKLSKQYDLSIFYAMLNPDQATIERYKKEY